MRLNKGDEIRIKRPNETLWKDGLVVVASENGRSIALAFSGEPPEAEGFIGDVFPLFVDPTNQTFEGFTGDLFEVQLARTASL